MPIICPVFPHMPRISVSHSDVGYISVLFHYRYPGEIEGAASQAFHSLAGKGHLRFDRP